MRPKNLAGWAEPSTTLPLFPLLAAVCVPRPAAVPAEPLRVVAGHAAAAEDDLPALRRLAGTRGWQTIEDRDHLAAGASRAAGRALGGGSYHTPRIAPCFEGMRHAMIGINLANDWRAQQITSPKRSPLLLVSLDLAPRRCMLPAQNRAL